MTERTETAETMGRRIALALRAGTIASMAVVLAGLGWALVSGRPAPADQSVVELVLGGGPDALVALGLMGLTLVPIVAVAVTALGLRAGGEEGRARLAAGVVALLVASLIAAALLGAIDAG